jgi:midasin
MSKKKILDPLLPNLNQILHDMDSAALFALGAAFKQLDSHTINPLAMDCIMIIVANLGTSMDYEVTGRLWISLGLAFVHSYIPDIPWDPVSLRLEKINYVNRTIDAESATLLIEQEQQFLRSGHYINTGNAERSLNISNNRLKARKWLSKLPLRPEVSQIADLFQDLYILKDKMLSREVLDQLLEQISKGEAASHEKEAALQTLLDSFIRKTSEKYPMYHDITDPLFLSIYQIRYGVRLCRSYSSQSSSQSDTSIVNKLLRFSKSTDMNSMKELFDSFNYIKSDSQSGIRIKLKLKLSALEQMICLQQVGFNVESDTIAFISNVFTSIVDLWEKSEEQRKAKELEEASLYKVQAHTFETEEEFDEAEMKKMFPDFEEDFADIDPAVKERPINERDLKNEVIINAFDSETVKRIRICFGSFIASLVNKNAEVFDAQWKSAYMSAFDAAVNFQNKCHCKLSLLSEESAQEGFLVASKVRSDSIEKSECAFKIYDFYNDENIPETCRLRSILIEYDEKIQVCLDQWPEHAVLLGLRVICQRIVSFSVTSPIMKLLTGLELLLTKSEDWEKYASKEYSLKFVLNQIVALIVSWRKLELNSWKELLEIESEKAHQQIDTLWFHLWRTIYHAVENEEMEGLSSDLLALLDDFCLESTLGEFESRLKMLASFHWLIAMLKSTKPHAKQIENMLWNVKSYYGQYLEFVNSKLEAIKQPILKDLKEYVKIATWYIILTLGKMSTCSH